jgi:hypothetical protein
MPPAITRPGPGRPRSTILVALGLFGAGLALGRDGAPRRDDAPAVATPPALAPAPAPAAKVAAPTPAPPAPPPPAPRQPGQTVPCDAPGVTASAGQFDGRLDARAFADEPCETGGIDDLDGDGVADCWRADYVATEPDALDGGWKLEVARSCRHAPITVDVSGDVAGLDRVTPLPPMSDAMVGGIVDWLFGADTRRCRRARAGCLAVDGALAWLIDWRSAPVEAARGGPLAWRRRARSAWRTGAPALGPAQVVVVERAGARALVSLDPPLTEAPQRIAGCRRFDVYEELGAVAVVDRARGRWTWVYVPDGDESISPIRCAGDLVLIGVDYTKLLVAAPDRDLVGAIDHAGDTWSVSPDESAAVITTYGDVGDDVRRVPIADLDRALR